MVPPCFSLLPCPFDELLLSSFILCHPDCDGHLALHVWLISGLWRSPQLGRTIHTSGSICAQPELCPSPCSSFAWGPMPLLRPPRLGAGGAAEPSSFHPLLPQLGAHMPSLAPVAGAIEGRRLAGDENLHSQQCQTPGSRERDRFAPGPRHRLRRESRYRRGASH